FSRVSSLAVFSCSSVPSFFRQRLLLFFFSISVYFFMAIVAQAYEVSFLLPVPCIVFFQCQLRMFLYVVHVMHSRCLCVSSSSLAHLAFILVLLQHFFSDSFPFSPRIEGMDIRCHCLLHVPYIFFCHCSSPF